MSVVIGKNQPTDLAAPSIRRTASGAAPDTPTTFFDGSYFSVNATGRPTASSTRPRRSLFDYTAPRWSYLFNLTLMVLDVLMAFLAAAIVVVIHPEAYGFLRDNHLPGDDTVSFLVILAIAWLGSLITTRVYSRHMMGEGYEVYQRIIGAAFIDFIALATFSYLFQLEMPRSVTVFVPLIATALTLLERWLMRKSLQRNREKGEYNYPTVLVGSPEQIHRTIAQLADNKALGYAPIAVCAVGSDPHADPDSPQHLVQEPFETVTEFERRLKVLRLDSHLPQTAKELGAKAMLITDVMSRYSETMRTLSLAMESMGIELTFSATVADLDGSVLHLRDNPSMPVFTARLPQYSARVRILKRVFDILGSLIALILSSPVLAYVAIRIKAEDGGPAIYSQRRIGLYGRPFTLYKFRSMRVDADAIKDRLAKEHGIEGRFLFKLKDDPRITRFGHVIRRTSLDEFPQLVNVLKGDMSLVGPRPPLPEEVARYGSLYSTRLLVKPGITGPWQVSGRSDLSQEESERLDVSYVERWSLAGDIAILLKTVSAVIKGTGSY